MAAIPSRIAAITLAALNVNHPVEEKVRSLSRPSATGDDSLVELTPAVSVRMIFRRFWPDARPFRGWLVLSLGLSALAPGLGAAAIWILKIGIDDVVIPHHISMFLKVAAAFLGITILAAVTAFADEYLASWIGESFLHRLRTRVFAHLHTLSAGFFDRRRLGDTLTRLTEDVDAIENLVLIGVAEATYELFQIVIFAGVMFFLNWQLALVSLIGVPIFLLTARAFSGRIENASREARRQRGAIGAVAEDSLSNSVLVQAYGREQAEVERFTEHSLGSATAELAATRIEALFPSVISVLQAGGLLAIVGVGIWELSAHRLTVGGLVAFLIYLIQLFSPIRDLGQLSSTIFDAAAGAERIIDLLDQRPTVTAPERPVALLRVRGELVLRDVGFRYPGTNTDAVSDISFAALPGQTTALVGVSGAGKTTLIKLLLRFHDPDRGQINLDGHDLRDLDPRQLRANIAVVLQETLLLDGTVAENILAGRPDADLREVIAAARAADAHSFITALPHGYDTPVGHRGRLLSGGQRQRIAIARAMIRDAPILLLDEPTASLDAEARERVLGPMRALMAGRTTIVISHDLLTVTGAQQILYLDRGRVTEMGTHTELLRRNGRYARLYRLHQSSGDQGTSR
jgi:ATP-binding cassette, subfamily B, bacterial